LFADVRDRWGDIGITFLAGFVFVFHGFIVRPVAILICD